MVTKKDGDALGRMSDHADNLYDSDSNERAEFRDGVESKIMRFITKNNPNKPHGVEVLLPELDAVVSLAVSGNIKRGLPESVRLIQEASDIGLTNNRGHVNNETKEVITDILKLGPSFSVTDEDVDSPHAADFRSSLRELASSRLKIAQDQRGR